MAERLLQEVSIAMVQDGEEWTESEIILSQVPDYIWFTVTSSEEGFPKLIAKKLLQGESLGWKSPSGTTSFEYGVYLEGDTVFYGYYDPNAEFTPTFTVKACREQVLVDNASLSNIANAIRGKTGTDDKYLPSEMADAIEAISASGGANEVVDFVPQTETKTVTIPYTKSGNPNFICVYTKDLTSLRASGQRLIWQGAGYADDGTVLHGGYAVTLESTGEIDYWNRNITYSIGDGTITITVERHMLAGVLYKIIVY